MQKYTPIYFLVAVMIAVGAQTPTADAYLSPSDVFESDSSDSAPFDEEESHGAAGNDVDCDRTDPTTCDAPANNRSAEEQAALQQSQRDFQYADIEDIEVHAAAPEEPSEPLGLLDDNTQYELRQDRMENSNQGNVTIILGSNGQAVTTSDGTVLHSGAPYVTATGSETVLMLILLLLAAASTVGYAKYKQTHSL